MLEAFKSLFCSSEYSIVTQEKKAQSENTPAPPKSAKTTSHEGIFSLIFEKDTEKPDFEVDIETLIHLKIKRVKDEICNYSLIISNPEFKNKEYSTKQFWTKNFNEFPNLNQLAKVLLGIQSSSAFIERFFSICGIVCKKRSANMSDDQIILRSFLKSNMKLLNEMNVSLK